MKKILLSAAAAAMMLASCQEETFDTISSSDEVVVSLNASTPEAIALTRAYGDETNSAKGALTNVNWDNYNLRYVLEIWDAEGENLVKERMTEEKDVPQDATFNIRITPGHTYKFVLWADVIDADGKSHYDITDLKNILVDDHACINDESHDAYTLVKNITVTDDTKETLTLTRPFGKIRVVTTDLKELKLGSKPQAVKVAYNATRPAAYNAFTGEVSGELSTVEHTAKLAKNTYIDGHDAADENQTLFVDYILATNEQKPVNFELTAYEDEDMTKAIRTYKFDTDIPVQRNYLTTIMGNVLTTATEFTITIDEAFANENLIELGQKIANGVYQLNDGTYLLTDVEGWRWFGEQVSKGINDFDGETVKLNNDINLDCGVDADGEPISIAPIGNSDNSFKGTFDGANHTLSNLYQSGWAFGYEWGSYGSLGLFGSVDGATIKNVKLDGFETFVEGGDVAAVTGSATGTCVFENISITNADVATYNNGCAGIIAWSGAGDYTFRNITIGSDVVLAGLWGSFDSSIGGIVGQAEPGATYNFENVTVNCRIDAYNDCTASYDYYNYRMCGMLIGRCEKATTIDGRNYPDLSQYNITCSNVVVNYGDWMNYHYCDPTPGLNGGRGMRVESGYEYDGLPADYDHSQCTTHHMECIPFNQLIGGAQYGITGLPAVDGVTVNYPFSFTATEVSSAKEFTDAIAAGEDVVLNSNIDLGTDYLNLDKGQTIDLNGKTLTSSRLYAGIDLKEGASIKNGTIVYSGNVAGIRAFNVGSIENVTINTTCSTANKTVTGIAVQQGAYVGSIKDVNITGVSQGIEVGYQATVDLIENVVVNESNNGTVNGIGLVINAGKVGKAKNCTFKGETYGITMHLKGVFAVGLELENCEIEGATASIKAWDEKGISNVSGSLSLTYDAATTLTGEFVWDFEEECQGVVTLNRP